MEIYLLRHGDYITQDPEQGLSLKGKEQIRLVGRAIRKLDTSFDLILSSPKKRSKQTASILAEHVAFPDTEIVETNMVKPMTPAQETMKYLREFADYKTILVAGHLPSVAEIISYLIGNSAGINVNFEQGTICRIDTNNLSSGKGRLKWFLTPAIIHSIIV